MTHDTPLSTPFTPQALDSSDPRQVLVDIGLLEHVAVHCERLENEAAVDNRLRRLLSKYSKFYRKRLGFSFPERWKHKEINIGKLSAMPRISLEHIQDVLE